MSSSALRWSVYWILILSTVGSMTGRIWTVRSSLGETPLMSANDRSRWCAVRALVDHGTFEIDRVLFKDEAQRQRNREWYTIDMVRHQGADGREHYYSSKPPLFPVLLAGPYWLVKAVTGATLEERPFYVVRFMLLIVNVLPLAIYLLLIARMAEKYGKADIGRIFVVAAAAYGTFLTTFAVTLNNHIPAAVSAAAALYASLAVWRDQRREWKYFIIAGFFAAFAVANELPALSLMGMLGAALLWKAPVRTLLAGVPAALSVALAFFATNYWAHDSWRPPYAHRKDGAVVADVQQDLTEQLERCLLPSEIRDAMDKTERPLSMWARVTQQVGPDRWLLWDPSSNLQYIIANARPNWEVRPWRRNREEKAVAVLEDVENLRERLTPLPPPAKLVEAMKEAGLPLSEYAYITHQTSENRWGLLDVQVEGEKVTAENRYAIVGENGQMRIRKWDQWYEYERSYWQTTQKAGVDLGEASRASYAFHLLIGHHGIFSLTPIWLLSLCGVAMMLAPRAAEDKMRGLAVLALTLTAVCLAFYIARPLKDRNYGGVTSGFRWMFWFAPLWLATMLPAADFLGVKKWGRWVLGGLLLVSAISASYASLNPWTHPWIYQYLIYLEWVKL